RAPPAEQGVHMEERLAPGLDATRIEADPDRIQRVLRNLLDNALRHTPAGGTIEVSAVRDTARVELRVSDSGSGVPDEELERIFDRFYRGERSRRRDEGAGRGAGTTG